MRALVFTLLALVTGCGVQFPATIQPEAFDIAFCVAADSKLSLPARDPQAAREYLKDLRERLEKREPTAIWEVIDLFERAEKCIR